MTNADRQRRYRERNGARVGDHPGPAPSTPCGTVSAYKRHIRHAETPCDDCRKVYNAEARRLYAARMARTIVCESHDSVSDQVPPAHMAQ